MARSVVIVVVVSGFSRFRPRLSSFVVRVSRSATREIRVPTYGNITALREARKRRREAIDTRAVNCDRRDSGESRQSEYRD